LPPDSLRYAICASLVPCLLAAFAFFRASTLLKLELPVMSGAVDTAAHSRPRVMPAAPAEQAP
jgi:hypothetical protein